MTKRDYIKLSEIFGDGLGRVWKFQGTPEFDSAYGIWRSMYSDTCEMLAADNPRFDEMKFQYAVAVRADNPPKPIETTTVK